MRFNHLNRLTSYTDFVSFIYPVRKPCCLQRGEDKIPFGANPVRDLSLNEANTGFKSLYESSRWKSLRPETEAKDLLTG
jgi:hypothetical protein